MRRCRFTVRSLSAVHLFPVAAIALGAPAQQALAQGASVLEEVIVTARKREESIQDVPVSVTAFSGSQLRDAGIANLKEIGLITPGLQIDPGSGAQIWIRGIGQRDDGSRVDSPVGVYVDGLYLPRKDGQLLDLLDVQSIQVLRGPQGTLFGKNTTGGALLVTTNPPGEELSGFIDGRVGSYDRQDIRGSINIPLIDDTLLSKITVGSVERDGYQQNIVTGQEPGSEDRKSAALQLRWLPDDALSIDALAYYGDTDEVQPSTACGFFTGSSFNGEDSLFGNRVFPGETSPVDAFNDSDTPVSNGFIAQSDVYADACAQSAARETRYEVLSEIPINFVLESWQFGLTVEWELSEDLVLKSISGYSEQEKSGNFGNPDSDTTALPISTRYRPAGNASDRDHWSQEIQLVGSAFDGRLDYTVGAFAMKENIEDGTDRLTGTSYGYILPDFNVLVIGSPNFEDTTFDLENTTLAAFFQGSYELTDNLELTAGLRWTSEERKQSVEQAFLDEQAFREIAFDAIADVEGIIPLQDLGIVQYADIDQVIAQDVFGLIQAQFPLDEFNQPVYPLISGAILNPELETDIDETWDEITPMVSLAYFLPDSLIDNSFISSGMFYATYAEGFKSGTFEPVGLDGQAVIEPETVDNYEIGWKIDLFDASMRLNGAIFRMDYDDIQLRQVVLDSSNIPRVVFRNASQSRIEGIELEWSWTPLDGLLLLATFSYNDYEYLEFDDIQFSTSALLNQQDNPQVDRSSEPFAEVPETTYSLGAQYTFNTSVGSFTPRLDYSYTDEIFMGLDAGAGQNAAESSFDDYTLWNARIGWRSPEARFEAALYATNLTDEEYYFGAAAVADSVGNFMRTIGLPRMYGLELRYNLF